MLQRAVLSFLLVALSGCDDVVIGDAHEVDADEGEGEESDGGTSTLDQVLERYAIEAEGEWQATPSTADAGRLKLTLSHSTTQPRTGSAVFEVDCPVSGCPPEYEAVRPRMMGPGDGVVGEYWFLKLKGANAATVIMDGVFPTYLPLAGSCTYLPAANKIDCGGVFLFSRSKGR